MMNKSLFKRGLRIRVPASTSNLGAGFDTLGLGLKLYLHIRVSLASHVKITIEGEGEGELETGESNLLYRAYAAACSRFALEPLPLVLQVRNEIPLQRGLGSSGAAVAAGLRIAQIQADSRLPLRPLLEIGCRIEKHPENVVASYLGGFCVNCLTDQGLLCEKFDVPPALKAVLLVPDFRVSTAAARQLLPGTVRLADAVSNLQRAALLVAAFAGGDFTLLQEGARDSLHQPYRRQLIPGFDRYLAAAYEAGARAAFLSGSGSTVLALADSRYDDIAAALREVLVAQKYTGAVHILEIDNTGAVLQ